MRRTVLSVLAVGLLASAVTACSTSSIASSGSGGSAAGTSSSTSPGVAAVQSMIAKGKAGLLYFDGEDAAATPDNLRSATGWQGPATAPKPATGKTIGVLYCVKGSTCEDVAGGVKNAAAALGWQTVLVDGKATPQGYADGMQTLLADKVDAIVTVAVPETVVANGIAAAHAKKVPVVGIAEDPTGAANHYDAYIPLHETLGAMIEGWYAIAGTDGHARVATLWDVGYPHLDHALTALQAVIGTCSGCSIVDQETADTATFANPVSIGQKASSIVQRYPGKLDFLLTAYDLGLPAITQAVTASGGSVKVATKNGRASSLALIKQGSAAVDSGTSSDWAGWAMTDELVRLFAGQPTLPYWKEGLPVHIFDQTNVPSSGDYDWKAQVDYTAQYRKLWGIGV